jgi:hypothetical protein
VVLVLATLVLATPLITRKSTTRLEHSLHHNTNIHPIELQSFHPVTYLFNTPYTEGGVKIALVDEENGIAVSPRWRGHPI